MQIAICDDDAAFAKTLADCLYEILELNAKVELFESGSGLLDAFADAGYRCDVLLLDIQMPGINGLETASQLRRLAPNLIIILITSFTQYALKGYDVRAFHFLVKPIKLDHLRRVITQAQDEISCGFRDVLPLHTREQLVYLPVRDITHIASDGRTVCIHTPKEQHSYYMKISELEHEVKGKGFFRVHRTCIVNLGWVQAIDKAAATAMLSTGVSIPISKPRLEGFLSALLRYKGGSL